MIALGSATRIYLAAGWTDMRRGFDGLADLARHVLEVDPLSGHLCIFCNRRKNRIKIIYFDGSGSWTCSKKLHKGCYTWPGAEGERRRVSLTSEELALLLGGIELERARRKDWWRREVA
jgi:transposase